MEKTVEDPVTIDFETEAIVDNPVWRPPRPVGVSILVPGEEPVYYAWGHPTENNCTYEDGRAALAAVWDSPTGLLFQNAAFDISVAEYHMGFKSPPDPLMVHDTMYLLFLNDPYSNLSLKPSAERLLDWAPEERDAVTDWLLAHKVCRGRKQAGAYISQAPGALVGRYANGDTARTLALYRLLAPRVQQAGMWGAYQREQRLAPIMRAAAQRGVRLDVPRLEQDRNLYGPLLEQCNNRIHRRLGWDVNIDSDQELADALEQNHLVTEWVYTEKGQRSTARKNLVLRDPEFQQLLAYRGALNTCMHTFVDSWLELASVDGRLHPEWNQVRGDRGDMNGAKTGRLSCSRPNFTSVPNDFADLIVPPGLLPVPELRKYLLPEVGHVWCKRDFSSQEMRIMAHFAKGRLYNAYHADPTTDAHDEVRDIIHSLLDLLLPRKYVKITGFGIMYGRGVPNLSGALGVPEEEGRKLRDSYFQALPEVKTLSDGTRYRGKTGQAIRTWGGRLYYREPHPSRDLSYKLLNYLIQGSAADQTKQSIIDWDAERGPEDVLLGPVHDEINTSVPEDDVLRGMECLRRNMDAERFSVPFLSEGFVGPNWADIKEYDDERAFAGLEDLQDAGRRSVA